MDFFDPSHICIHPIQPPLHPMMAFQDEVDALRKQLVEVEAGERFILQGGDCAERFQDCNAESECGCGCFVCVCTSMHITHHALGGIVTAMHTCSEN